MTRGLVLTRKIGESVDIGEDVRVTVIKGTGSRLQLQFEAPRDVKILRSELREQIAATQEAADGVV